MDPLGAVCSMTNPSQSHQISMTNFAPSQQKKIVESSIFCGILNPTILAFRMYEINILDYILSTCCVDIFDVV